VRSCRRKTKRVFSLASGWMCVSWWMSYCSLSPWGRGQGEGCRKILEKPPSPVASRHPLPSREREKRVFHINNAGFCWVVTVLEDHFSSNTVIQKGFPDLWSALLPTRQGEVPTKKYLHHGGPSVPTGVFGPTGLYLCEQLTRGIPSASASLAASPEQSRTGRDGKGFPWRLSASASLGETGKAPVVHNAVRHDPPGRTGHKNMYRKPTPAVKPE